MGVSLLSRARRQASRVGTIWRHRREAVLATFALKYKLPDGITQSLAFQAGSRGDHETALGLWRRIGDRHPDWAIGFAGRAGALRRLKRWDEAKHELQTGLKQCPDDALLIMELGRLFLEINELDAALLAWRQVVSLVGDLPESYVGYAATLRALLRFDEADAVLEPAMVRFPDVCDVFANHAVTADMRGDRAAALRRWQVVFTRFPNEPIGYAGMGAALKVLGRISDADTLLLQGMRRFPDDTNVAINHAWVAVASGHWPEAVGRWTTIRGRWPDDPLIRRGLAETLMQAQLAAADSAAGLTHSIALDDARVRDPRAEVIELMMRFESIGENCELGFVQRHFEAEPLGLFRWAGIAYGPLLEALESQLAGIGSTEHTVIAVNNANHEYYSEDRRYGLSMHTFLLEGSAPADVVTERVCRRLVFLKDKLLKDLHDGNKIFVFNAPVPLLDEDLRRLQAALQLFGPVPLLHVAPHGDELIGTVVQIEERLWRGGLRRTGYDGVRWDIEFDTWLDICRAAARQQATHDLAVAS